jgi:hypothetical protein
MRVSLRRWCRGSSVTRLLGAERLDEPREAYIRPSLSDPLSRVTSIKRPVTVTVAVDLRDGTRNKVDIYTIALWLGHESTKSIEIYLHADNELKQHTSECGWTVAESRHWSIGAVLRALFALEQDAA